MERKGIDAVLPYFNEKMRNTLGQLHDRNEIQEIRLRSERPLAVKYSYGEEIRGGVRVTAADIEYCFRAVCEYSIHSFARELSQGFVTIAGGNRVGLCGTAICEKNSVETIKYISGMNFRIASERKGSADRLISALDGKRCGVLIIGAPSSGKTTVLRDFCRQLGNRTSVSLIDERGEIAAVCKASPQNDVGTFTDIFDGYPKAQGIETALRVMSPEYIFADEIGNADDVQAIESCIHGGAYIVATAHAGSFDELMSRKRLSELMAHGAFGLVALLGQNENVGKIIDIHEV